MVSTLRHYNATWYRIDMVSNLRQYNATWYRIDMVSNSRHYKCYLISNGYGFKLETV